MKLFLCTVTLISSLFTFSQNVYIPDSTFKSILVTNSSINTNGDTEIQLTEANGYTGSIIITNNSNIINLTGLQEFTNTNTIDFQFCSALSFCPKITSTALLQVFFWSNQLDSIDLTGLPNLKNFRANRNQLTLLDLSNNPNLERLWINNNQLDSLDLNTNPKLLVLEANENNLVHLNSQNCTLLSRLFVKDNNLASINVATLTVLEELYIDKNPLINVNLSNNLLLDYYSANEILASSIDLSHLDSLQTISLSSMPNLTSLNIANGNNTHANRFYMQLNPNLTCIQVDDTTYAKSNSFFIFKKDSHAKFSLNCSLTTSLNESKIINNLSIYPNPTNSILNIDTKGEKIVSVRVFTISGQLIEAELNNNNTIDVSNYKNGLYILQVETQKGTAISRFIKQ